MLDRSMHHLAKWICRLRVLKRVVLLGNRLTSSRQEGSFFHSQVTSIHSFPGDAPFMALCSLKEKGQYISSCVYSPVLMILKVTDAEN